MNPLKELGIYGQSVWLDYLKRSLIATGDLHALIENDGIKGVTSNPSIFEKAMGHSGDYDDGLRRFQLHVDHSIAAIYEHLAIADIRGAADVLRPVYDETKGKDGYISLECSPYLANDPVATVAEALRLWRAVGRPNLMVKVPATAAGLAALRQLIGKGLNINVTLLFAVNIYEQVVEAYLAGLEELAGAGGDLSRIGSVASFFVSRIDVAVDAHLEAIGDKALAERLRGKAAIANAKLAYARYQALFSGPRWLALAGSGARPQRLLWASTGTKNPAYRDTFYVESLVGRDTVDTIPPATMDAFRDHGAVVADVLEQDVAGAQAVVAELATHGILLNTVAEVLVGEGVSRFAQAFDKLLGAIARQRRALVDGDHLRQEIIPGSPALAEAIAGEMEVWRQGGNIRRLWEGDKSLWSGTDEDKWVGWLHVVTVELAEIGRLHTFAEEIGHRGFTDIVLLGMGGSSLGPEVLAATFGRQAGIPCFRVLDSTDPAEIKAIEGAINLDKTLFIVSSKSGSTLEPNIFLDYFFERISVLRGGDKAGDQFVAVTDPGSSLEQRARQCRFAHVFNGVPSIGGRYSVLSKFGLVPATAMRLDTQYLLATTQSMLFSCGPDVPPAENPAVQLGIALGVAATRFGRDKVTLIASPGIAGLGPWLEQLLAESTGKRGKGLIPLAGEPLGRCESYGADRFFVYLELEGHIDPTQRQTVAGLAQAGHPVARISVRDIEHIGQEFFRWEMATAVAAAVIGVDPFDQPDVEAAKAKARALTMDYSGAAGFPKKKPLFRQQGLTLFADPRDVAALGRMTSFSECLRNHFRRIRAGDYVALLAFIQRSPAHQKVLTVIRANIRDRTHAATCLGFGPRFLHSTGQAFKGGANTGVFLQITCDSPLDFDVPGHPFSFGAVKAAQAEADLAVLADRGRRVLRVHLDDVEQGLANLAEAIATALEPAVVRAETEH